MTEVETVAVRGLSSTGERQDIKSSSRRQCVILIQHMHQTGTRNYLIVQILVDTDTTKLL